MSIATETQNSIQRTRSIWNKHYHGDRSGGRGLFKPNAVNNSAIETLDSMAVPFIEKRPLGYTNPGEEEVIDSEWSALVRHPYRNEDYFRRFGVVSNEYDIVHPEQMAQIWDDTCSADVTLQFNRFYNHGGLQLLSGQFDTITVGKDDAISCNFSIMNPMNGGGAIIGRAWELRMVCSNGMTITETLKEARFKVSHIGGSLDLVRQWVAESMKRVTGRVPAVAQAYNHLATQKMTIGQMRWVVDKLYPMPEKPMEDTPRRSRTFEEAMRDWKVYSERRNRQRVAIVGLFDGNGVGIAGNPAAEGTRWGAFNALTEFATYRAGRTSSMVKNIIAGDRHREIRKGFDILQSHNIPELVTL